MTRYVFIGNITLEEALGLSKRRHSQAAAGEEEAGRQATDDRVAQHRPEGRKSLNQLPDHVPLLPLPPHLPPEHGLRGPLASFTGSQAGPEVRPSEWSVQLHGVQPIRPSKSKFFVKKLCPCGER